MCQSWRRILGTRVRLGAVASSHFRLFYRHITPYFLIIVQRLQQIRRMIEGQGSSMMVCPASTTGV